MSTMEAAADQAGRKRSLWGFGRFAASLATAWLLRHALVGMETGPATIGALAGGLGLVLIFRGDLPKRGEQWAAFTATISILGIAIMPPSVRAVWSGNGLLVLLALPIALHILWGFCRGWSRIRGGMLPLKERFELVLGEILPLPLARLAAAELNMLSYAFRWAGRPDVPKGAVAFSYHRLVSPMMWAFLFLALIEISVVHIILYAWKPSVAWFVFVVSDIGFLYLLGLIGSLRRLPILLFDDHLRIRAGILFDFLVPLASIRGCSSTFGDVGSKAGTLKVSMLASPNVIIDVMPALPSPKPFGKGGPFSRIALAVDEPIAFQDALRARMRD